MKIIYLTLDVALKTHRRTIDVSGGGIYGYLDTGRLESVLEHIQNDDYYPTLTDKITHLFFCACKFHCFEDGNKRIAITLVAQMLLQNGYLRMMPRFFEDMENISYHVAAGRISKDLLHEILESYLNDDFENESLKLKILEAISPSTGESKP
jgi:death-on-curing protein